MHGDGWDMRFLAKAIAFGTTGYPEKVARRLRVINILAYASIALIGQFAIRRLPDPAPGMWEAGLGAILVVLLLGVIPLLHRFGPSVAIFAMVTLVYADMFRVTWSAGIGGGYWVGYLIAIALIVVVLGAERIVASTFLSVVAVALMWVLHLNVPFNAGEMPDDKLRNAFLTNLAFYPLLIFGVVLYAARQTARAEAVAEAERARSDRLLASILPDSIAGRLKDAPGEIIADRYDEASILFADLAGFTSRAGSMTPEEVVRFLDRVFSAFDDLAQRFGVEKIKTNGDGYMAAAGVPVHRPDHARALAELALAMLETVRGFDGNVELRVGIASGPVVAGVVGTSKFYFDVWGDTVNIASRMESTAERGHIQVSEATAALLGDAYRLEPRGMIDIKGKGQMPTWYLREKPPA